jgi:hypothetical protein
MHWPPQQYGTAPAPRPPHRYHQERQPMAHSQTRVESKPNASLSLNNPNNNVLAKITNKPSTAEPKKRPVITGKAPAEKVPAKKQKFDTTTMKTLSTTKIKQRFTLPALDFDKTWLCQQSLLFDMEQ